MITSDEDLVEQDREETGTDGKKVKIQRVSLLEMEKIEIALKNSLLTVLGQKELIDINVLCKDHFLKQSCRKLRNRSVC
jgi:hypothetical protein